jgi:hypothetical protein
VPTLDCSAAPNGRASIWVGVGGEPWPTGATFETLLQTGVQTSCVNGSQQDFGWFEEWPNEPNAKAFPAFPVLPGDSIEASVYQTSTGAWVTRVDDLTTRESGVMVTGGGWGVMTDAGNGTFTYEGLTTSLSYSGGHTAEWIVEDNYAPDGPVVPLADYGTVNFTNLTTGPSPWALTTDESEEIIQNVVVLSTPSLPLGDGFSVSYTG